MLAWSARQYGQSISVNTVTVYFGLAGAKRIIPAGDSLAIASRRRRFIVRLLSGVRVLMSNASPWIT